MGDIKETRFNLCILRVFHNYLLLQNGSIKTYRYRAKNRKILVKDINCEGRSVNVVTGSHVLLYNYLNFYSKDVLMHYVCNEENHSNK